MIRPASSGRLDRVVIALGAALVASPTAAQDARREAREALARGYALLDDLPAEGTPERIRRCAEAGGHLERSVAVRRSDVAVYELARALYCQGRYVAAIGRLEDLLADPRFRGVTSVGGTVARSRIEGAVARWREQLVTVRPTPSGAAVTVDGQAVAASNDGAFRFDPGNHIVEVRADGRTPRRIERAFVEGERLSFSLDVLAARAEPHRTAPPVVSATVAAARRVVPSSAAARVLPTSSDVFVTQPPPEERRARWILPVAIGAGVVLVAGAVVAGALLSDPGGIAPPPPLPGMLGGPYATRP